MRYDQVNAMLLNEFLKEHKKVEKLESVVASLAATVKEQASQIQKVSAQLEASKPAPQMGQQSLKPGQRPSRARDTTDGSGSCRAPLMI